ncbi:MAG: GIY-YIG nuclease family protein [Gammaproteobacteria bacterium]|nr:GIY-YIG nuclease family protein [Gammaproteobacteria bacterium]
MSGYLYILSNPSFPGLLKIGHTTETPEQRLRQLSTTGVPSPFVLEACFLVTNSLALEQAVHGLLVQHRFSQNREFFKLSLSQALELTLPLIIQAAQEENSNSPQIITKNHGLTDSEVHILQVLVSTGGQHGVSQIRLESYTKLDQLDLEINIANLVAKKFISRSRESNAYNNIWRSTPKGTKFLADNNLIEEWMR